MPVLSGGVVVQPGRLLSETILFTEAGAGTYTGTVTVPGNSLIHDIKVWSTALWAAAVSAAMSVGDAGAATGWYNAINLKATHLLTDEQIRFESTGGREGAYLVTATGELETAWSANARVISGVVTSVGAGTAGRTYMQVIYTDPVIVGNATKV